MVSTPAMEEGSDPVVDSSLGIEEEDSRLDSNPD